MNVLLLEPDFQLGSLYKSALQRGGHKVAWARTAQTAISELDQVKIDIVVTELQLALHNGVEFLYELRSYQEWQDVPIVLLTDLPKRQPEKSPVLKRLNIASYLYKPATSLQNLVETLDSLFAKVQ